MQILANVKIGSDGKRKECDENKSQKKMFFFSAELRSLAKNCAIMGRIRVIHKMAFKVFHLPVSQPTVDGDILPKSLCPDKDI